MKLLVLTDRTQVVGRSLLEVVGSAINGGARHVVLREKDLPRARRLELAIQLRAALEPVGGRLIAAGPDALGGDAVHLASADPPVRGVTLTGRSCHNEGELAALRPRDTETAEDYVTLSPVFLTSSKPGYGPALGLERFACLCRLAARPVYALGGVTAVNAADCVAAGAAGVAVMGEIMRAADPADYTAKLLSSLGAPA